MKAVKITGQRAALPHEPCRAVSAFLDDFEGIDALIWTLAPGRSTS
jgi:hypothetical protein